MTDRASDWLWKGEDLISTTSRDFVRGRMAELCSTVNDARGQLEDLWQGYESRFGAELDPMVRGSVLRAVGRAR